MEFNRYLKDSFIKEEKLTDNDPLIHFLIHHKKLEKLKFEEKKELFKLFDEAILLVGFQEYDNIDVVAPHVMVSLTDAKIYLIMVSKERLLSKSFKAYLTYHNLSFRKLMEHDLFCGLYKVHGVLLNPFNKQGNIYLKDFLIKEYQEYLKDGTIK